MFIQENTERRRKRKWKFSRVEPFLKEESGRASTSSSRELNVNKSFEVCIKWLVRHHPTEQRDIYKNENNLVTCERK